MLAKAFLGTPAQNVGDRSGLFGDELRKVAQNKAGPKQMEPEGFTHISQWGAFGGLRCNAARRLRFAAPREGERWRVELIAGTPQI